MTIRVLGFTGCPHFEPTLARVREIAERLEVAGRVERVEVSSDEEAARLRFLGSPTVQVDGVDVDPGARGRSDFRVTCRLYGASGVPPDEWIDAAIREAAP